MNAYKPHRLLLGIEYWRLLEMKSEPCLFLTHTRLVLRQIENNRYRENNNGLKSKSSPKEVKVRYAIDQKRASWRIGARPLSKINGAARFSSAPMRANCSIVQIFIVRRVCRMR